MKKYTKTIDKLTILMRFVAKENSINYGLTEDDN